MEPGITGKLAAAAPLAEDLGVGALVVLVAMVVTVHLVAPRVSFTPYMGKEQWFLS